MNISKEFSVKHSGSTPHVPVITPRGFYASVGKRLFDVCFTLAILPFYIPLLLVLMAAVKSDGGPAFYVQPRVGKGGKKFNCLKLRSMRVDADAVLQELCRTDEKVRKEWELYQKLDNDPCITRIGNLIRKTSLDELPQFINVLRGEMSLLGPRPMLPSQEMLYSAAGGRAYFSLRPGISGSWQVSERNESTFVERVGFDEAYKRELSFALDLKLILLTLKAVAGSTGR